MLVPFFEECFNPKGQFFIRKLMKVLHGFSEEGFPRCRGRSRDWDGRIPGAHPAFSLFLGSRRLRVRFVPTTCWDQKTYQEEQ